MGNFRIEIQGAGGHGCQRDIRDGGYVVGCGKPFCPDCITREFIEKLRRTGSLVTGATLVHWPGQREEVVDDLFTHTRKGSFPQRPA